jgi:CheY-like chemotaxis protein
MQKAKILVVDDDPDIRVAITTILESQDYEVDTASDGVEALERLRQEVPDLLILDLLMPRKDGFEVIKELRGNPKYAKLPILILTSVPEEPGRRRYELETGLAMDVQDYVEKPIPPADLLHRVEKLVKRGE